jgi:hypothetical protein
MTVSLSKESRYRNIVTTGDFSRGGSSLPLGLLGAVAVFALILCCACAGLLIGLERSGGGAVIMQKASSTFAQATPTPDKTAPVPLKKPGLADNGLELTVISVQNPLKVEGGVKLPPDQQFILVTVQIRNTKKSGAPIKVTAADFKVKGDGGLTYDPNPKSVTIPGILAEANIAPGKDLEGELIYQIAADDSGLKLYWKVGSATRIFLLEQVK